MLNEIDYRLSEILDVLGNAIRLKLVIMLFEEQRSVTECAKKIDKSVSSVSRHFKRLRDIDLVEAESKQNRRMYELKRPDLIQEILNLRSLLSRKN